jgi:hypothetical protein
MTTFTKDPDAQLDFSVDWSDWFTGEEEIASVTWTVETGLTNVTTSYTGTTATIWLSGGKAGRSYKVSNRITTDSSPARTDERTFTVSVENR